METDKKPEDPLAYRINLLRNLSIPFNLFALVQLVVAVILPDILTTILKTWIITVGGCLFVGLTVAQVLARGDSTSTLFLTLLSVLISGFASGVSLVVIVTKIKN